MLLSSVLNKYLANIPVEMVNEIEFDVLAITDSETDRTSCVFLDNVKFISHIKPSVKMVMTTPALKTAFAELDVGLCITEKPRELFFMLHNALSEDSSYYRERFTTVVGSNCHISPLSSIATNNVTIGDNVTIEEFVVIRENTVIGDNTIIRAGAKIGGQGFEFKRSVGGIVSVAHLGGVIIGKYAEIQYNTCIDKAVYPFDNTIIGDYSKLDNLVHIGHAVKVANNVMIVANSGVGGRTVIKDNSWIGFAATIINGITVGENSRANIGSVVTKSIPDNGSVTGNFAIEHSKFINNLKIMTSDAFQSAIAYKE